jgi:Tol biopolymer transport system component
MRADPKSQFRIAIIPAGGGEPRWLSPESPGAMKPRWSPDGRDIAFLAQGPGPLDLDLLVASVSGGPPHRVASVTRDFPLVGYTWNLDGKGFNYFTFAPEQERGHYTLDLAGKATRTPGSESIPYMVGIEWSADQSQIAFSYEKPSRLYLAGPHGEHAREVAGTEPGAVEPSWAPDGRTLLYSVFRRPTSGPTLWRIDIDGRANRSLAADGIRGQYSPDGQWIAYLDTRGTNSPANPSGSSYYKRVCKARPGGSGVVVLTR